MNDHVDEDRPHVGELVGRWVVEPEARAVRRVRRVVAVECRQRGLCEETADSVVSAVDELAANALRYGPFELRVYEHPLAFAVADARPYGAETVRGHLTGEIMAGVDDERGRGLTVVAALFPEHTVAATTLVSGAPGKEIRLRVAEEDHDRVGIGEPEPETAGACGPLAPSVEEAGRAPGDRGR